MSQFTESAAPSQQITTPREPRGTATLLTGGILAGPVFLVVWALQAFTRDGFDPSRHPLSLLSLGDPGWIQIANFIVTGALFMACAAGLQHAMSPGMGSRWGPRLIAAVGAGLIVAGVFVTDAGAGFPAGAPSGAPKMSWHGALHEVGYVVAVLSWTAACLVFRRRFAVLGQRRWTSTCVATVAAVLLLSGWPDWDSFTIRVTIATAVQLAFIVALAASFRRQLAETTATAVAEQRAAATIRPLEGGSDRSPPR